MHLEKYETIENTKIDFKEKVELNKPKSWLKSISAFANTSGGILLFGVRDKDREAIGIDDIVNNTEKITELINNKIIPLPRYELNTFSKDCKNFIELKISNGPKTPYYYDSDGRKEAYIRAGNESVIAPKHILEELILKGENLTFDALPSRYTIDDVSFTLLNASLKNNFEKSLTEDKDYISLDLMTNDKKITNAGALLSDQGILNQSQIFCTRWKGLTKGTIDIDALDDKEYQGSIISLLENAENFIQNNSKKAWKIEGLYRVEFEEYPMKAVREAIVNAIIHRDYQIIGSEIHIDMYDDRLTITSPGGMLDGSLIQNLDIKNIPSMRRNKIIADIFLRLNLMERRGSGLEKIIKLYQDSEKKPQFYSGPSWFMVTFPNKKYVEKENYEYKKKTLNYQEKIVMKAIEEKGKITSVEVAKIMNRGKTTAIKMLNKLIEKDLIVWTGTSKNDEHGRYIIK